MTRGPDTVARPTDSGTGDPGEAGQRGEGLFSCVIDDHPRFHLEALRWFATLTTLAGVDPADLLVNVVGRIDSDALEVLRERGVAIRSIVPFDARSPHSNKIAGALSLADDCLERKVVLTDADVVICEDPRGIELGPGAVGMKPVDQPNPPLDVLRAVFTEARVALPPTELLDFGQGESVQGNGNGGLYIISEGVLEEVAPAWSTWARWLLERGNLLGDFSVYLDQVAMALALADREIPVKRLDPRWNTPTHEVEKVSSEIEVPSVMHYHGAVEPTGLLSKRGIPAIDTRVEECNAAITALWVESFPNATFWEWRYRSNPDLGSGVGSRGAPLSDKRAMLESVLGEVRPGSILDVGSGDGETTRRLDIPHYTGIDRSPEAVLLGRAARPDGTFLVGTLADHPVQADLTICLDVLIHQPDRSAYTEFVGGLLRSAREALLVSGYEDPPTQESAMTHFHEPLSATLERCEPGVRMRVIRVEHEITTWLVDRRPSGPGPNGDDG